VTCGAEIHLAGAVNEVGQHGRRRADGATKFEKKIEITLIIAAKINATLHDLTTLNSFSASESIR
jgi:hypothetical protein